MNKIVFGSLFLCVFALSQVCAQSVGIGTVSPDEDAVLELVSSASNPQGVQLPRVSTLARKGPMASKLNARDEGMLVFDRDEQLIYSWDGDALRWRLLGASYWERTLDQKLYYMDSVGIGTNNPVSLLTVAGKITADSLALPGGIEGQVLTADDNGNVVWANANGGGGAGFNSAYQLEENTVQLNSDMGDIQFVTSNNQEIIYLSEQTGQLGVSNTDPMVSIDIGGAIALKPENKAGSSINVGDKSYIRLTNNLVGQMELSDGLTDGQMLVIQSVAPTSITLLNDGNTMLSDDMIFSPFDTLTLIWDDNEVYWVELSRSFNNQVAK